MSEEDEIGRRNVFGMVAHLIPPFSYLGRCLDDGRYLPVIVFAVLVIGAIAAAIMTWGIGVMSLVAEVATALAGLIILSLTT